MEAELAELQLELLADLDRRLGRELLDRALAEHAEVVEMDVVEPDEEEALLRQLLELGDAASRRARRAARRSSR